MPQVVTFSNGNTITYLYNADGRKLRTVHVINGTATTTDYCGNVIYENGTARLLLTEAGYVDLTDNGHHFYIKDHLGNNRVVADANGTVEESNQYYPFGLLYANSNSSLQPYKYNGKELDTKAGLNWYDYGARHYDAALGRWHVVDPLAEKYYSTSSFSYCLGNPIKYIDFLGCDTIPANEIWDYDLMNSRTDGMGIMDNRFIPVKIDGYIKYHLHKITTGENKGNYLAIEQLGTDINGVLMYEYKYVVGKDKVSSFIDGNDKTTGIQYNMLRFAKDSGVDFDKGLWENMFNGYIRILTDPMNWLPNPLDPINIVPKSYHTINPWNRFLMLNRGKYTKDNYGTYKNALKQRSIDYKKWKR